MTKEEDEEFNRIAREAMMRRSQIPLDVGSTVRPIPLQLMQEPDHGDELTIAYMSGLHRGKELAVQRPWVGLTDEERTEIRREHYARTLPLMDAVEAKLKEKNT